MITLSLPAEIYARLSDHLSSTEMEQVAFLFTEPPAPDGALRATEIYCVPPDGFEFQSGYHVALTDDMRAHVIKRAWGRGGTLVEVHSHSDGPPVWFSLSDLHGFEDWVPHVRWRLHGRPYIALVFGGDGFDALVWEGTDGAPSPLAGIAVDGDELRLPSGITYDQIRDRS